MDSAFHPEFIEVQSARITPARSALVRLLYTHNPFYAISAALVFWGMRISFDVHGVRFASGWLLVGLTGYTLLLAVTAWLIVRLGQVWEDARSLLMLVVLMFLGLSVSFDKTLSASFRDGGFYCLGGLAFAVVVSEALLHGLRVNLPPFFRIPYHLALALFFLYPVAIRPWLEDPLGPIVPWLLLGFNFAAGAAALTLLPAIRRGSRYVQANGTPWQWPWFPWTLFGVLALGVCLRSYYLCVSMHFIGGSQSVFGIWFLAPFVFAVAIVLLEMGIVSRNAWLQRTALAMPLVFTAMMLMPHRADGLYFGFLQTFHSMIGGTPAFCTLLAGILFGAWAALRRVDKAWDMLAVTLAGLSVVGPTTTDLHHLTMPSGLPWLGIAVLQLWPALRRQNSRRATLALIAALAGFSLRSPDGWFMMANGFIPVHLFVVGLLILSRCYADPFARRLQYVATTILQVMVVISQVVEPSRLGNAPPIFWRIYPLAPIVIVIAWSFFPQNRWFLGLAMFAAAVWIGCNYHDLRRHIVGLDQIALGGAFFVIAAAISLTKAGFWQRHFKRWWELPPTNEKTA